MSTTVLNEVNGVRLLSETHVNGVEWYKVVTLPTEEHAASLDYEGSERRKAESCFRLLTEEKGQEC